MYLCMCFRACALCTYTCLPTVLDLLDRRICVEMHRIMASLTSYIIIVIIILLPFFLDNISTAATGRMPEKVYNNLLK